MQGLPRSCGWDSRSCDGAAFPSLTAANAAGWTVRRCTVLYGTVWVEGRVWQCAPGRSHRRCGPVHLGAVPPRGGRLDGPEMTGLAAGTYLYRSFSGVASFARVMHSAGLCPTPACLRANAGIHVHTAAGPIA